MNTVTKALMATAVFSAMFVVGMQFDFSRQALVVYETFSDSQTQKATITEYR